MRIEYAPPPTDYTTTELPQESAIYCDAPTNVGMGPEAINFNQYAEDLGGGFSDIQNRKNAREENNDLITSETEPKITDHCDPPLDNNDVDCDLNSDASEKSTDDGSKRDGNNEEIGENLNPENEKTTEDEKPAESEKPTETEQPKTETDKIESNETNNTEGFENESPEGSQNEYSPEDQAAFESAGDLGDVATTDGVADFGGGDIGGGDS
jgi:hypothetical protein